jgi:hypothetical protein
LQLAGEVQADDDLVSPAVQNVVCAGSDTAEIKALD